MDIDSVKSSLRPRHPQFNEVISVNRTLNDAFLTDVRPILGMARTERGLPPRPSKGVCGIWIPKEDRATKEIKGVGIRLQNRFRIERFFMMVKLLMMVKYLGSLKGTC